MKTISLEQYATLVGYPDFDDNTTLADIQEWAEEQTDTTLWDYPIEEYDYTLNEVHDGNDDELVFVFIPEYNEVRVCEV